MSSVLLPPSLMNLLHSCDISSDDLCKDLNGSPLHRLCLCKNFRLWLGSGVSPKVHGLVGDLVSNVSLLKVGRAFNRCGQVEADRL